MYNKLVIGVDQSYTRSGISIAADNKLLKVGSINYRPDQPKALKREIMASRIGMLLSMNLHKANDTIIIVERIRQFSGGNLSMGYIKSTAALIATIVDTAYKYDVPVYSVDTRAWKAQIIGTSTPLENIYNISPKKWPTIKYLLTRSDLNMNDILAPVSNRCKKYSIIKDGVKYLYNDDAADSAGIALYGFCKRKNLKREE